MTAHVLFLSTHKLLSKDVGQVEHNRISQTVDILHAAKCNRVDGHGDRRRVLDERSQLGISRRLPRFKR